MHQIDAFVVKSEYKIIKESSVFAGSEYLNPKGKKEEVANVVYHPCLDSLKNQAEAFEIPVNVELVNLDEIPRSTDSFLTIILHQNSLIPEDYLPRIMAMNNLHRSAACFCGPVYTRSKSHPRDWFISRILKGYKNYEIDSFGTSLSCKINTEVLNYPPIFGCVFSSRYYNDAGGYEPLRSPRHDIENNTLFFKKIDTIGDVIYSSKLNTSYFVTAEEFEIENFSKYYYSLGYQQGLMTENEKIFDRIAENYNWLELQNLEWCESNEEVDIAQKFSYTRQMAILKCSYQLGFYEAVAGEKIV